jgi:hypothetical protein
MATTFPIPPTYTLPVLVDPSSGRAIFSPIWLQWFLDLAQILTQAGITPTGFDHQSLGNLQGGSVAERHHLTAAQATSVNDGPSQPATAIALGLSPALYHNTSGFTQIALLTGGAGLFFRYSTDNITYYNFPSADAVFVIGRGHYLEITYAAIPVMTVFSL